MKLNFTNKKYVITGVTSGIGKEVCTQLLSEGAIVLGIGRSGEKIENLRSNYGLNKLQFIQLDLSNIEDIENALLIKLEELGPFDGLLLCAGREETLPLSSYKPNKIKSLFEINIFSNIEMIRIFSKKKFSKRDASIVLISSVMSILGQPGKVGYCSSKSATLGLVKSSALELAKKKIRINAISPGVVLTPMTKALFNQLSSENIGSIENMHPLGLGDVSQIYPLVMFLLSDKSTWITGQNYIIDGGYSIH